MAFTLITPIWFKPPFKSDLPKDLANLYLKLCGKQSPITFKVRKSLLEPGTYIVDPGSFYLRPAEEITEQERIRKDSKARQILIARLKSGKA